VSHYLVRYRRSTGDLLQCKDLGSDRARALGQRFEDERVHKDDPDIEVVLLTASSLEALLRTHARYFKTVSQLAIELAGALPDIS